jgi:hypothetical protein
MPPGKDARLESIIDAIEIHKPMRGQAEASSTFAAERAHA